MSAYRAPESDSAKLSSVASRRVRAAALRVVTAGPEQFEALYIDVLAKLPHVQKLTSQLAMKSIKRTTQLPVQPER